MRTRNSERGIAFLIVAIAVFLAATLAVTVVAEYSMKDTQRKADSTRLATVYRAIVGEPAADTFGYLGDVAAYPTTLKDLIQNPGVTGWSGPYLSQELFTSSTINDAFGSPMEYFLSLSAGSVDELAIISKGSDHSSSNSATDPNDRTQFTTPNPSSGATYTNAAGNPDNIAYPNFFVSPATAIDYENTGKLAYNIVNKDANQANAIVGACPLMYSVVATSRSRGSTDTITLPYSPGLASAFPQGLYDIAITSVKALSPYFSEAVGIYSGRITAHRLRVEDINSLTTPATFHLFIRNNSGVNINVFQFAASIYSNMNTSPPDYDVGPVNVCGNFTARVRSSGALIETWTMPWGGPSTRVVSTTQSALTVTNTNASGLATQRQIQVWRDGVPIGTVYQRKAVVFNNISSGAAIVVKNQPGTTTLESFAMPASATPKNY